MATVTYTFVSRCAGGDHVTFDIAINNGNAKRMTYSVGDLRQSFTDLTEDEQEQLKLLILKAHFFGKTRAQVVSEFQANAGTVTVTL